MLFKILMIFRVFPKMLAKTGVP